MAGALVAGRGAQPVDRLEHLDHELLELAAALADPGAGAAPVEQGDAELALELGDGLAQRRLRDVQVLARAAQGPVLGHRREVLQLLDPHTVKGIAYHPVAGTGRAVRRSALHLAS